ncbi:MAG: hypothetical protein AB7E60_01755 [Sphingobium sp.]
MSGVREKALRALLNDPVTGAPLSRADRVSLAIGMVMAVPMIIVMIALALGLGGGR